MLKLGVTGLLPPGVDGALPKLGSGSAAAKLWVEGWPKLGVAEGVGALKLLGWNAGTDEDRLGVGTPLVGKLVETFAAPATFSCVRP